MLEHELRVELFIRNGRGMRDSAGQILLDSTTGLVRQIEQVRDDIQSASGKPSGRVILGLVQTVSAVLSGRLARRIITDLPDISLRIVESYGGHLVEWLHRGEMDLAITYGPADDLHLSVHSIGTRTSRWSVRRVRVWERKSRSSGMAGQAKADTSQHFAWPAGAAGKGRARKKLTLNTMIEADSTAPRSR